MTPAQVAAAFNVNPQTVMRWADNGTLACIRTPGGTRRYPRSEVEALLNADPARCDARQGNMSCQNVAAHAGRHQWTGAGHSVTWPQS